MLVALEKACGERLVTCPWQALRDPYVAHVMASHRWWRERQLETKWGGDVPAVIVRGIEVYDSALNAVQVFDMRERQKRDEAEAARRANEGGHGGRPRPLPQFRRRR